MKVSISECAAALEKARTIFVLTGAGISVPSGIPDFRSETGLWTRYPIEEFATIQAFQADPVKFWQLQYELLTQFAECKPNKAHCSLVDLENMGLDVIIATQNIDGLHQVAGSRTVIELHGSTSTLSCMSCDTTVLSTDLVLDRESPPECEHCAAYLRPDIVYFGESLPAMAFDTAIAGIAASDMLLSIGTSSMVFPAAGLPGKAYSLGKPVVELNLEHTELTASGMVSHLILGDVEETLPQIVEVLRSLKSNESNVGD